MAMKRARNRSYSRNVRRRVAKPSYRTRSRRPKYYGRRRKSSVRRSLPDSTRVAMSFTTSRNLFFNQDPNVPGYYFKMNSLFDPDGTGGISRPYGYSQYTQFFQKYRVHAVKWRIRFYNPNNQTNTNDICVTAWDKSSTSAIPSGNEMQTLKQLPRCKSQHISTKQGSTKVAYMKGFTMNHKIQGVSKFEYNTDLNYECFTVASPTQNAEPESINILQLNAFDPLNSQGAGRTEGSVSFDIKLVYYCTLFRRATFGMS